MIQRLTRIAHVLQAVAGMSEIEGLIGDRRKQLRVTVLQIPGAAASHQRKLFGILSQHIRPSADIETMAHEVAGRIPAVVQAAKQRFARFVHDDRSFGADEPLWTLGLATKVSAAAKACGDPGTLISTLAESP